MDATYRKISKQQTMALYFEDVDDADEYSEGIDDFTKLMDSREATAIGSELSTSRVTVSERTRTLSIQGAPTSNRSPSPMDIDSVGIEEKMQVDERRSSLSGRPSVISTAYGLPAERDVSPRAAPTPARTPPSRSGTARPAGEAAVPAKRPTDMYDTARRNSPPPSPSALPQPAKRLHAAPSMQRKSKSPKANYPPFGSHLDPFIIAHDAAAQQLIDELQLAWGTAYELARGVTKDQWSWNDVTRDKLEKLRGDNACAALRVQAVIRGHAVPRGAAADVWAEYDREQGAILENRGRGLGGMGLWKGKGDWYGGQIQQVGRLERSNDRFFIQLEKPEIRRSHRFSRFLGSRRLLRVRVNSDLMYNYGDEIRHLLCSSKFILCGRVFLPFHAKEGSMHLVETNQDFERQPSVFDGDHLRLSLNDFITWHNPLYPNRYQPISKWSTRWALGLSTSVPTVEIEPENILDIPDVFVSPQDWEGKAPAEKTLTDGCGLINGAALTQIMRLMKYGSRPTAVQGRIAGSKGMWILHPDPLEQVSDGPAKIWIRPSQTKIQLGETSELDRAHRIFDLLAPSRVTSPSRLSSQTLINLSHNGINHELLKDLMALGMKEEIQPFIDWTQPQSMIMVWKAVERAGSVVVSRLRRLLAGQARALGLGQLRPLDDQGQEMEEEEDGDLNLQPWADIGHKKSSGQPITLHESVLELLQAGFHPLHLQLLFDKLDTVITLVLNDYVEKFHIPVMESCEAYIVPDPYGVLEEGQVHFRSSEPIVNPVTGEQINIVLGDVLVSRNPTRLPSDIQKVRAVAHPKLSNYVNVIVFPIKGKQSLASFLGGGDYDGDTVMINWCKPLVEQFKGSPLCTAPTNLSSCFEREVEYVRDFDNRVIKLGYKEAQQNFQRVLLLGLAETRVGLYSTFHDTAVYKCGYGSPQAIHLAYMFTTCLDASKTGLRVKLDVFEQDKQQWGGKKPWYAWKLETGRKKNGNSSEKPYLERKFPPFILDVLLREGDKLKDEVLEEYRSYRIQDEKVDQDLSRPWYTAKAKATEAKSQNISGFSRNLEDIQARVDEAWGEYQRAIVISNDPSKSSKPKNDLYDKAASSFAKPPCFRGFVYFSEDDVQILKASFASTKSLQFAFCVAFHDLCSIKARATGDIAINQQFAQCFSIPGVVIRTFSQAHDASI